MSEFLDLAPSLPRYGEDAEVGLLQGRRPGLGEFLGATVGEGWWGTTLATGGAAARAAGEGADDPRPISREDWRYHPLWRENVEWDERMTEGRARSIARVYDENRYRRALMEARDPGAFETVLGFGGQLLGSIPDPVNFVPIAGPLSRLARVGEAAADAGSLGARMLAGTARTLDRPGVSGSALRGAVDAVGGNILAAPVVYGVQAQFGDEITFDRVVADLAIGALIGTGFGAVGGLFGRARETMNQRAAVRIMDAAARDVAAGRSADLPAALVRRTVEDAVVRSAPPEAAPLMGDGDAPLSGLPRQPDGAPLDRDAFAAIVAERQGTTVDALRADAAASGQAAQRAAEDARKAGGLVSWLVRNGGLSDAGGDLRSIMGTVRARPGLVNNQPRRWTPDGTRQVGGMAPDEAVRAAREAGFFPDREVGDGEDAITPADLFNAIDEELRGLSVRRPDRQGARTFEDLNAAERAGVDLEARLDEAYGWYREALEVERRLSAMPDGMRDDVAERAAMMEFEGGLSREEATARAGREAAANDPELAAALRQIDALRAEGRLGAGDDAVLRAGDEQAAELDAVANGLEEAAACSLRNAA